MSGANNLLSLMKSSVSSKTEEKDTSTAYLEDMIAKIQATKSFNRIADKESE